MAKIKGWKKIADEKGRVWYIRRYGVGYIKIEDLFVRNGWGVLVDTNKIRFMDEFKTKKQALKFAINYMKANPNG